MHTADRASREKASDQDTNVSWFLFDANGIEGGEQYNHRKYERCSGEGHIIQDLDILCPVTEDDGAVTDEVHAPDSDATHGDRGGEE